MPRGASPEGQSLPRSVRGYLELTLGALIIARLRQRLVRAGGPGERGTDGQLARLAIAGAVAVGAAWVAPPLAILLALPFLAVVPGWFLAARCVPALSAPGRLGVGVVVSVYAATHLTNGLALLLGAFTRDVAMLAVALLVLLSLVAANLDLPHLAPPPRANWRSIRDALVETPGAYLVATGTTAAVLVVLGLSAWRQIPGGWSSGGWNWSDFLVHLSIGSSLMAGNFPPQVPYFSGVPLAYHWFGDMAGAVVSLTTGVDLIAVDIVSSAVMAGALALVVWELAWQVTRDARTAWIATILVVFTGGMGWIRLPMDIANGTGDLPTLLATQPYDNTWASHWPFFRIASVFGTGLLTHRATTFGLPGLVTAVLLAYASLGRFPSGMLLAGLVAALLAPFHFYAFPATYLLVALLFLSRRAWTQPTWLRDAFLFLAPIALALPFIVGPVLLQRGSGAFRLVLGWSEARFADGPAAVAFFYLTNLGIPFVLALVALARRRVRERLFLGAWVAALFLVPNLVVASSVEFDMNKYFQMMWVAVAIAAATWLRTWRPVVLWPVLAVSALSPALIAVWSIAGPQFVVSAAQQQAAAWIAQNTPQRAVFVTDAYINSPIDLAGRLRVTSFGPYVANLGYDPAPREAAVKTVRCGRPDAAAAAMREFGATYVLSSGGLVDCGGAAPTNLSESPRFEVVFDGGGVTVWHLRG
ncbi:MAG: DUF2298 domain-containing protein [Candidatus Limnocylindrales bacterium]